MDEQERTIREEFEKAGVPTIERMLSRGAYGDQAHRQIGEKWVAEKKAEKEREEEEKREREIERAERIEERKITISKVAILVSVLVALGSFISWLFPRTDSELEERITRLESRADSLASQKP